MLKRFFQSRKVSSRVSMTAANVSTKVTVPVLKQETFLTSTIPYMNTTLDPMASMEDLQRRVHDLLLLLPYWHLYPAVTLTRLSGALTNIVYLAASATTLSSSHIPQRRVLVRVYGTMSDSLFSRSEEMMWMRRLGTLGLAPKILVTFDNGRLEEFVPSTTCNVDRIREPAVSRAIAAKMAELHTVTKIWERGEGAGEAWWDCVVRWGRMLLERENVGVGEKRRVEVVMELAKRYKLWLDGYDSPIVLGHNDLQYGNILITSGMSNSRTSHTSIALIDFEYAGFNPRGYDIANHFCEFMYNYHNPTAPEKLHEDWYPTEAERKVYLTSYLEHCFDGEGIMEQRVLALDVEVRRYKAASHLVWGLWGLMNVNKDDTGFMHERYAAERLKCFEKLVHEEGAV